MEEENKKSIAWGISSLVTSIISLPLIFMPYFGLPLAIYSIVAHNKQKKSNPTGISMAGFVTGVISVVLNSIMLLFVGLAALFLVGVGGTL